MNKYIAAAFIFLVLSLFVSMRYCSRLTKENVRLGNNQRSLMVSVNHYRTKDSLSVASVERLTLSNTEFKRYCTDLEKDVTALNLKVKRLQSVSQTTTKTDYIIKTEVRDSIVYRTTGHTDTLHCISYQSPHLSLNGCTTNNTFSGSIESRDTLVQIVHRIPRRFLFFRYGTKAIRQEVMSKNPHTTITYSRYIELKR